MCQKFLLVIIQLEISHFKKHEKFCNFAYLELKSSFMIII